MNNYKVSISKNKSAREAVKQALDLLGGIGRFVSPGERILIKPNGLFMQYMPGTVTSPEVLAAVAEIVLEAGAVPIIGENDLVYDPSLHNFETHCGKFYHEALERRGLVDKVPMMDTMKDEMVDVDLPLGKVIKRVTICKSALTADKIIDLPVMKTHDQTQVTMGIKNLKGLLPITERIRFHEENVEQAIADLFSLLKPALTIVDGTVAGEGLGPGDCTPVAMDVILAGDNSLATDMVGSAVMGFDTARIKFIGYAAAMGLGPKNLQQVDILGLQIAEVAREFETAEAVVCRQYNEMGIDVISNNVCSGCWAEFRHIYYSLGQQRNGLEGMTFALGRVKNLIEREKLVSIGNCAKAAGGCQVPGCPPHHTEIDAAVRKISGIGGEPKKLGE